MADNGTPPGGSGLPRPGRRTRHDPQAPQRDALTGAGIAGPGLALAPPPDRDPRQSWQAGLRRWAAGLFELYLAHPWLLDAPVPGMPVTPHHAMWVEHALAITRQVGLTTSQRLEAALLIDGHLRIIATLARAAPPAARAGQQQRLADQIGR